MLLQENMDTDSLPFDAEESSRMPQAPRVACNTTMPLQMLTHANKNGSMCSSSVSVLMHLVLTWTEDALEMYKYRVCSRSTFRSVWAAGCKIYINIYIYCMHLFCCLRRKETLHALQHGPMAIFAFSRSQASGLCAYAELLFLTVGLLWAWGLRSCCFVRN